MHRLLFLLLLMLFGNSLLAQSSSVLDRTGYRMVFYDEFDYPDKTNPTPATTLGMTSGQRFYDNWKDKDLDWGDWNYIYPANTTITGTGLVRFSTIKAPAEFIVTQTDGTLRPCTHYTGKISSYRPPPYYSKYFKFGIMEARVKFPTNRDVSGFPLTGEKVTWSAFWTCCGFNEIDIFDCAYVNPGSTEVNEVPVRLIDWYYGNSSLPEFAGYPQKYEVTQDTRPMPTSPLSDDFHIFSAIWSPSIVTYYLDGNLIGEMPFSVVRIHDAFQFLNIGLLPRNDAPSGQEMDVDWIKIWTKNCVEDELSLPDVSAFGRVTADQYRYDKITSASASLLRGQSGNGTVLEANSITILPNFLVDESVHVWGIPNPMPPSTPPYVAVPKNYEHPPVHHNGYFRIEAIECKNCDHLEGISGPNEMCRMMSGYSYSCTPGGGRWVSSNPDVHIDPISGVVDIIPSGAGYYTTITYVLGECRVSKKVRLLSCSKEYVTDTGNTSLIAEDSAAEIQGASLVSTSQITTSRKGNISVLPNPATRYVTISYRCLKKGSTQLKVRDVSGRLKHSELIECNANSDVNHNVDIGTFLPGVYFIELTNPNEHVVIKIVKL